jgi:hypothetical protein
VVVTSSRTSRRRPATAGWARKAPRRLCAAGGGVLAGLGGGGADAAEQARAGAQAGGEGPAGEEGGLVVAAEEGAPGVEGDGDDGVPVAAEEIGGGHEATQGAGELELALVLERGHGAGERALVGVHGLDVGEVAVGRGEGLVLGAAQGAQGQRLRAAQEATTGDADGGEEEVQHAGGFDPGRRFVASAVDRRSCWRSLDFRMEIVFKDRMSRVMASATIRGIRGCARELAGVAGLRGKFATPAQAASRGRDVACIERGWSASLVKRR